MSEPAFISLSRRAQGRKSSRRGIPSRKHVAACVEQLEARRMMTPITPVVGVTQTTGYNAGAANPVVGGLSVLNVHDTADFAASGDLFVETTTGVATVHYTGKSNNQFTGLSFPGDTYGVGAGDTTGKVDSANPAVFQATNLRFEISVPNQTGVSLPLNYSMLWSSPGGDGDLVNFYALGPGNAYENFATVGNNNALPSFAVNPSGDTTTISLPYMPTRSARIYFSTGASSLITAVDQGGGQWAFNQPAVDSYQGIYDYFEVNLNASGVNNTTSGSTLQYLPTLTIDSTQVDQFGIPMTISGGSNNGATVTHLTSGVTDSTAVARDAIIDEFLALHPNDAYSGLVLPASPQSQGQPLRIVNPGKLTIANNNPLGYLFDKAIQTLFETNRNSGLGNELKLTLGTDTYTGTPTTVTAYGSDSAFHTYNVLAFTGTGITGTAYVYEPFFFTNAPATPSMSPVDYSARPPAPMWLSPTNRTAGAMVFGNDGVFTDYGVQLLPNSAIATYDATTAGILAGLENQIVSALNRGVANSSTTTAGWTGGGFYPDSTDPNLASNQYAKFLHQGQVHSTQIMIGGNAYAFAYDDQGGNSTTLALLDQTGAMVVLGPWTTSAPAGNNDAFLTAVYQDVLHRAVDPSGHAYWLGLLNSGTPRADVSLAIVNSVEHRTDIIEGFYSSLLNRTADAQGLNGFLQKFEDGWTESQIKSLFYGSNEYLQTRGGGTASGFVDALYQDQLDHAADSQSQALLGQLLADGQTRVYVATIVVGSTESNELQVNGYYLAYLFRPADPAGMLHWASVLAQTNRASLVEAGLLGSQEFFNRS